MFPVCYSISISGSEKYLLDFTKAFGSQGGTAQRCRGCTRLNMLVLVGENLLGWGNLTRALQP